MSLHRAASGGLHSGVWCFANGSNQWLDFVAGVPARPIAAAGCLVNASPNQETALQMGRRFFVKHPTVE